MEEEKNGRAYIIPKNYEDSFITSSGISFRSIGEGLVLFLIVVPFFVFIPIPWIYRFLLIAVFGGGAFASGVIGIKHCYLSEFILDFFKFKTSAKIMERNDDSIFTSLVATIAQAQSQADAEENDKIQKEEQAENNKKTKKKKAKVKKNKS